jgi:tetratricopeptide (TPR) repeat protein
MKSYLDSTSENSSHPGVLIILLSSIYLVLLLAPIAYPVSFWGVDHLSYFDWGVRLGVIAVSIVAALLFQSIASSATWKNTVRKIMIYVVCPLLLLVIFYLLRVRTHYLGDGLLRADNLEKGIWILPTEPLASLINTASYKLTSAWFGFTSFQAVELVSYISGVLFYFAGLYLVRSLFTNTSERAWTMVVLLFSGMTLLFCGYVESYMLLPAAIALFLGTAIRSLKEELSPGWAPAAYLVLLSFHLSSVYLLPAVALLTYILFKRHRYIWAIAGVITIAVSLLVVYTLPALTGQAAAEATKAMIPLSPSGNFYWLFSGLHMIDIANELFLIAGPALIAILALLISRKKFAAEKHAIRGFLLVASGGAFLYLILLDPRLGYAGDWDLFAPAGVIITTLALFMIALAGSKRIQRLAHVALMATALAVFASYALVNANYNTAMEREVAVYSMYGERGGIGLEMMGADLKRHDKLGEAVQLLRKAVKLRPHPRTYSRLAEIMALQNRLNEARYYAEEGLKVDSTSVPLLIITGIVDAREKKFEDAVAQLRKAIRLEPNNASSHLTLGTIYSNLERYSEAEPELREAVRLDPKNASARYGLANCLFNEQKLKDAETEARMAIQLQPKAAVNYRLLAAILAAQGNTEAIQYLRKAIQIDPTGIESYVNLAELYSSAGRPDLAVEVLNGYLTKYPHQPHNAEIEKLIDQLKSQQSKTP